MMSDVLGQALLDFHIQAAPEELWINNRYGEPELMDVAIYFRSEEDMTDLEWVALNECRGSVLDIGSAAGSHALELQTRGYDVTALDISPLAAKVIRERGVHKVLAADIFTYQDGKFDTLLLLMNGIGLAGTLPALPDLLNHLKTLLNPGGQILFDSSDISYLYEDMPKPSHYIGEVDYQYEYKNQRSDWFKWLYVDEHTLLHTALGCGFDAEILYEDEYKQYLAKLTLISL